MDTLEQIRTLLVAAAIPTFITELGNRTSRELPLTMAEASQMAEAGFRFAEFNPKQGRYRLSKPDELVMIRETNTITIRQ